MCELSFFGVRKGVEVISPHIWDLWYAWYLWLRYIIYCSWPTDVDRCGRLSIRVEVVQYHVVQPADLLLARVVRRRDVGRLPHDCNRIQYASQLVRVQTKWLLRRLHISPQAIGKGHELRQAVKVVVATVIIVAVLFFWAIGLNVRRRVIPTAGRWRYRRRRWRRRCRWR